MLEMPEELKQKFREGESRLDRLTVAGWLLLISSLAMAGAGGPAVVLTLWPDAIVDFVRWPGLPFKVAYSLVGLLFGTVGVAFFWSGRLLFYTLGITYLREPGHPQGA